MALNEQFLQELKFKTDIEDIISAYVSLKKRGSTLIGLCPFHNEKTPSFTVYPDTQSFYCFGCGSGGDAIGFIRKIENLDYWDAVKLLAQRAGIQMPQEGFDNSLARRRRRILEANREAAKFFHAYMLSDAGQAGYRYYLNRGLTKSTITKFGLGYAPDQWDGLLKHLKQKSFSVSEMLDAGLIKKGNKSYYDNFRNRVITPIIDVRGNVIAFGGRVLDDSKPKYINTGDTLVYKKTNELFALNFAKDSGEDALILCEGYMDAISMHQAGFYNAVAGCGTALTGEQVRLITRYAKEVILVYDNDEAGKKALNKAVGLFNQTDIKIRIPAMVGGKDPDEIIKEYGRDKFKGMLDGASNEIEYSLVESGSKYNLKTTQGKIDFLNDAIKILAKVSPVEQDLYLSRLAEELGVEKQNIKIQLKDYLKKASYRNKKSEFRKIVDSNMRETVKITSDGDISVRQAKAEDRLLGLLIRYPDCYRLCKGFNIEYLSTGFTQKAFSVLTERLENGGETDLIHFSDQLSQNELARLSGIIAKNRESKDAKKEFSDCLSIIIKEFEEKHALSASDMSDDDFRNMFKKNT